MGLAAPSFAAPVRDAALRGSIGDWPAFCSNLFFISLTVLLVVGGAALPVTERIRDPWASVNLSSTGLEAERWAGLAAMRVPDTVGRLEEVALLVERVGGVWRLLLLETTEAIGSWAGEATRPSGSDSGDWW